MEESPEGDAFYGVDRSQGRTTTYTTWLPPGHGVQVTLTPHGVDLAPVPVGPVPLSHDENGTVGCAAVPGVTSEGWAPSPFGDCEPDYEQIEWHDVPVQRLVFATNGEYRGAVEVVNFPEPWDAERHGVFVLSCNLSGAALLDTTQFFHYTEATCSLFEFGLPLWEYDEWRARVRAEGNFDTDPDQLFSMAILE